MEFFLEFPKKEFPPFNLQLIFETTLYTFTYLPSCFLQEKVIIEILNNF